MPAAPSRASVIAGKAFVIVDAIDGTGAVLRQVESNFFQTGRRLQMLGTSVFTKALMASVPSALSTRIFTQFDDSMRRVEARATGTAEEMAGLRDQARALGMNSAFSARQVALLMDTLGQLKFTRADIGAMTHPILMLGRTAGSNLNPEGDIQNAANLVGQAIMMYGLEAKDAARVADIFTQAANESNFALDDLIIAMATAGPVARQYGMSLEETLATMMVMRDVSIDASVAGTGLRNIFLKASDKKAVDDFNKMMMDATGSTIEFVDAAGNLQRPVDILKAFFNLTQKLGTARKGELLAELFGLRAITPATAVASNIRGFEESLAALTGPESIGATSRAYKTIEGGLGGAMRAMLNSFEGLAITVGETLSKTFTTIGAIVNNTVNVLNRFIQANRDLIVKFNLLLAATFVLAAGLFTLGTAFRLVSYVMHPLVALSGVLISLFRMMVVQVYALAASLISLAASGVMLLARSFGQLVTLAGSIIAVVIPALTVLTNVTLRLLLILGRVIIFFPKLLIVIGSLGQMLFWLARASIPAMIAAMQSLSATIFAFAMLAWTDFLLVAEAFRGLQLAFVSMVVKFLKPALLMATRAVAVFSAAVARQFFILGMFILRDFAFKVFAALVSFIVIGLFHMGGLLISIFTGIIGGLISLTISLITTLGLALAGAIAGTFLLLIPLVVAAGSALLTLLGSLAAAIGSLAMIIWTAVQPALQFLLLAFQKLWKTGSQILKGVVDALMRGDLQAAMDISIQGMKVLWLELQDTVLSIWERIKLKFDEIMNAITIKFKEFYRNLLQFDFDYNPLNSADTKIERAIQIAFLDKNIKHLKKKKFEPDDKASVMRQGAIIFEKLKLFSQIAVNRLLPQAGLLNFNNLPVGEPFGAPPAEIQNLVRDGVSTGISGGKALDAMQQGSVEAAKAAYENEMNRRENIQAQQLKAAEEANNKLGNIERNTRNLTNLQPTVVGVV